MNAATATVLPIRKSHLSQCYDLIKELAEYEKAPEQVLLDLATFTKDLETQEFIAWVAILEEKVVGMALCYPIYSTWKGKSLHLEDLIVGQAYRRKGIGKILLDQVVQYAKDENVGRLQWQVLDWNEPAISFYKNYPIDLEDEWLNARISNSDLKTL